MPYNTVYSLSLQAFSCGPANSAPSVFLPVLEAARQQGVDLARILTHQLDTLPFAVPGNET